MVYVLVASYYKCLWQITRKFHLYSFDFRELRQFIKWLLFLEGWDGQTKIEHRELEFEDNETENDDGVCNENEIVVDVCQNHYKQFSKL